MRKNGLPFMERTVNIKWGEIHVRVGQQLEPLASPDLHEGCGVPTRPVAEAPVGDWPAASLSRGAPERRRVSEPGKQADRVLSIEWRAQGLGSRENHGRQVHAPGALRRGAASQAEAVKGGGAGSGLGRERPLSFTFPGKARADGVTTITELRLMS